MYAGIPKVSEPNVTIIEAHCKMGSDEVFDRVKRVPGIVSASDTHILATDVGNSAAGIRMRSGWLPCARWDGANASGCHDNVS